jgi:hypothetical protein
VAEQLAPALAGDAGAAVTQSRALGMKQIDGMMAEGTQATMTIPAGVTGNVKPIVSTEETWTARELRVPLLVRTTHPFTGETVMRLRNLSRLDPPAALFAVPADYTVREIVRR